MNTAVNEAQNAWPLGEMGVRGRCGFPLELRVIVGGYSEKRFLWWRGSNCDMTPFRESKEG